MFSNVEEEKLYSTGNDELDELLERAFCEGYEYAQKEYARRDYDGLTEEGKEYLRKQRSIQAETLAKKRARINKELTSDIQRNTIAFGPMSSDPGNPRKLEAANARDMASRNKQFENALRHSRSDANALREDAMRRHSASKKLAEMESEKLKKDLNPNFINRVKRSVKRGWESWENTPTAGKLGKVAAGATILAGAGYGIKKLADHNKDKKKMEENK